MPTIYARHYATGAALRLTWQGATIRSCTVLGGPEGRGAAYWPLLSPGLSDIQINGYRGRAFDSAEDVERVVADMAAVGVVRMCPTVCTGPDAVIGRKLAALATACRSRPDVAAAVPLIHLEGPYLSAEAGARGAHPAAHLRDPDWEHFQRLQERAEGRIGLVTLAPERPGALPFIAQCVRAGITVAIGHTLADAATVRAAVDAGARLATHLGNGLPTPLDRHRNPLWPQLADDRLYASFIADGEHLPPEVLCAMVRAKGGPERSILVSDAVAEAGLPPGRYPGVGGLGVEVLPSGRVQLQGTPYLAGSGAQLAQCITWAVRQGVLSLTQAIDMASRTPAACLGWPPADLRAGAPAHLMLFLFSPSRGLEVLATVRAGTVVHGRLPAAAAGADP